MLGRGDRALAPFLAPYGAGKAWVRAVTLATAAEFKGTDVRIHAVDAGIVIRVLVRTNTTAALQSVRGFDGKLRPRRMIMACATL